MQIGIPEQVAPGIRRITCGNPSPLTGPGTNSYLLGPEGGPVAVVDPGPVRGDGLPQVIRRMPGATGSGRPICMRPSYRAAPGLAPRRRGA